ncbi:MAG: class II aldolase/adducin family protein [Bacillota bacterium]|uniref:class II aldolase/adducin family protein n=1 Tax=Desulfurispora thermophila TaxID=265470 RepID=UPI0003732DB2|nr:class II aldolase/adducin family protein [Desulfurispora thermophila]
MNSCGTNAFAEKATSAEQEFQALAGEIINTGRAMCAGGLVLGTWGNISCRCLQSDLVLITPSGMPYDQLVPTDIVCLDGEGNVVRGNLRPSSEYLLHLAIYRRRSDVRAIVHTHSIYASALAALRQELPPLLEETAQVAGGAVPCTPYARAGTVQLAEAAAATLGQGNAVLLANHGVVGVGRGLDEALTVCQVVEKSAMVYLLARSIGRPHILPPDEVVELRRIFTRHYGQPR